MHPIVSQACISARGGSVSKFCGVLLAFLALVLKRPPQPHLLEVPGTGKSVRSASRPPGGAVLQVIKNTACTGAAFQYISYQLITYYVQVLVAAEERAQLFMSAAQDV